MCYVDIKDIIYIIKHIGLNPKIYTGSSQCPEPRSYKDNYKRWYCFQETTISSEAFYTSEQELTI